MRPASALSSCLFLLVACTRADGGARPEPAAVAATSVAPETPRAPEASGAPAAPNAAAGEAPTLAAPPAPRVPSDAGSYDPGAELRRIAATYKSSFTQVTGVPSWALGDCALPPRMVIPFEDLGTHADAGSARAIGQKLYYLYARDASAYRPEATSAPSADQVVVKESWTVREAQPSEVGPPGPRSSGFDDARMREVFVPKDPAGGPDAGFARKILAIDKPAGLFVIWRAPEGTPGTDAGWLYGTVSPDGAVGSVGAVASCVKCHRKIDHGGGERLYG